MSLFNAYYIPRTETKVYTNGQEKTRMTSDFKRYQLLRTAALFGFDISEAKPDKLKVHCGSAGFFIDGRNISDPEYIVAMNLLREQYNKLRRASLSSVKGGSVVSQPYQSIQLSEANGFGTNPEGAYPENKDPLHYASSLIEDLQNNGCEAQAEIYKKQIITQLKRATFWTRKTSWGSKIISAKDQKCLADSLEKFSGPVLNELRPEQVLEA